MQYTNIYKVNKEIKQNIQCMNSLNFKLGQYYAEKDFAMVQETIADIENQLSQFKHDIDWLKNRDGIEQLG
jgi:DNA-binding transcriptional regulator GbsR (MarR family)